jgi:hypothetical protein
MMGLLSSFQIRLLYHQSLQLNDRLLPPKAYRRQWQLDSVASIIGVLKCVQLYNDVFY